MSLPGGKIQRAELFANVDSLLESRASMNITLNNIIEGSNLIIKANIILNDRENIIKDQIEIIQRRLDRIDTAIDQLQRITEPHFNN